MPPNRGGQCSLARESQHPHEALLESLAYALPTQWRRGARPLTAWVGLSEAIQNLKIVSEVRVKGGTHPKFSDDHSVCMACTDGGGRADSYLSVKFSDRIPSTRGDYNGWFAKNINCFKGL